MGFKTKWNRFWTLRNTEGGFTLVELIVVIAILAILAGVAVPAYTGYIKRAREAADQLLIAAVNEAFVSSCLEAGVEMIEVTDAKISVSEQKVFGVSSVEGTTEPELNLICNTFAQLFEGNFATPFVTENVMSLDWVPEEASFKMDHETSVPSRVVLNNGKSVTVSPEAMAQIQDSAYADMGYTGVRDAINNVSKSGTLLAEVAGGLGMMDKLTDAMISYGIIGEAKADEMADDLAIWNILSPTYGEAANEAANGLQMITAKYLASGSANTDDLLNIKFTDSSSMLSNMTNGSGTKTVTAAALQYALVESFAVNEDYKDSTVTYTTRENQGTLFRPNYVDVVHEVPINEFLASEYATEDPIRALAVVQASDAYKDYTEDDQYQKDINGFVGTMTLLGSNVGSVNKDGSVKVDGAISPDAYLSSGINGAEAEEVLSAILGK